MNRIDLQNNFFAEEKKSNSTATSSGSGSIATEATSPPITICGVNPREIYGSSSFSSIFNKDITPDNFITIVINKGTALNSRVANDAVITLITKQDSFGLNSASKFSNPMESSGAVVGNLGGTAKNLMQGFNPLGQATTGISLFNKIAYLPIWSGSDPATFNFDCLLYATSDPLTQVHQPIDLLQRFVVPSQMNSFLVAGPGPTINSSKVQDFLADMTKNITNKDKTQGADNFNFSSLFTGSDIMSIQIGSMAFASPVILRNFSFTVPNKQNSFTKKTKIEVQQDASMGPTKPKEMLVDVTKRVFPYAEVKLTFTTYYPLVFAGPQDYDSLKLFPNLEYEDTSSTWDKIKKGSY